ncbi:2-dehydropantoate 2-reductase [Tenacibaculum holothuriorum]|uniref:2-dehydropantoate 2-reductase n=1 Tax=Tenacibaculum holothuriorum TaxID=1635173 RepID=A0A1Y2PBJ9_9FLAO|nr:2-dehydropantoate 2-reductase [Tenacibaculum holothuriorum]OSY87167.1 2-dehydropantoate 2-reductase [Tenacibaculum holothuriorum]
MNIVVYGTGGVGGYFGIRLAQSGQNVTFIARGKHLEAIQKNGLQLKSIKGDFTLKNVNATDDVSTVSNPDLILIATKTWQLEEVANKIQPILNDNTVVISLLNGADNAEKLANILGEKHVLGGLCKIVSKIEEYGVINHMAIEPYIAFGELNNSQSTRIKEIKDAFDKAEIFNQVPDNIQVAIWSKFLFITTISALGGLTKATLGEMRTQPEVRNLMLQTAEEIVAVANAKGIPLNKENIQKVFHFIDKLPYETTASLQRDIMEGRPSELDAQVGTIHKMGQELNISTPINSFIYHSLIIAEKRNRKESLS